MRARSIFNGMAVLALAFGCSLGFSAASAAQGTPPTLQGGQQQSQPPAPKVDPAEEADYKAFFDAGPSAPDTRIQLGNDFLTKYPMSRYAESVYAGIVQAYYNKQDWKNFYDEADKGLQAFPDDIDMLALVGWVIPHIFNPNASGASASLDKAEKYEKHAIELIGAMPKPAALTDDQFAQTKSQVLGEAHSGLGLVYFRQQKWADSVSELQQATQASASPDPTDYYVMGVDFDRENRYPEAAEAYTKCSQIAGGLQDRCKQSAENAKKQASQPK